MYSHPEQISRLDPLRRRMVAAFDAVLPPSAIQEVEQSDSDGHVDAVITVGPTRLTVEWIGRGSLRDVDRVLRMHPRPDVIVATKLSLAARAAASAAGLGWVDETGAAELVTDGLVVSRSGDPRRSGPAPKRWTRSVLGVAEALLCGTTPTASATAEATGHSVSSTVHALATLTELGLLEASARRGRNSGRKVVDPDRLLDEYADAAARLRPALELRCGLLWREPFVALEAIGERWDRAGTAWATTGAMGASILAPFLTEVTNGEVYVDATTVPELLSVARIVELEPMEGGRLVLRPFPTATSRTRSTVEDGLRVAPWPRVFADVRQIGVRGEEAAEHLREVGHGR